MTRVTIHHCRDLGYCTKGVRAKCVLLGVDFRRLVREGIPVSEIEDIDDSMVRKIIKHAKGGG